MAFVTYTDPTKMRERLGQAVNETRLQAAIDAAAEAIYNDTGKRRFDLDDSTSPRLFVIANSVIPDETGDGEILLVDDIGSDDDLVVEVSNDGATWTEVTDHELQPLNASARDEPWTDIRRPGTKSWSRYRLARITAKWGWPRTPASIKETNQIVAERLYRRKDAPFGVAGIGEFGVVRVADVDPDAARLIKPYRRETRGF